MAKLAIIIAPGIAILIIIAIIMAIVWIYKTNRKKVEWFSQHIVPENPREGRNISEDVLVYDYDNDCNLIAYYSYNNNHWCFIGAEITWKPKTFKWRYLDIDIDEP
jgi:hypothetical protein